MVKILSNYKPTAPQTWQGRADSLPGEYFFQKVAIQNLNEQNLASSQGDVALLGFCCDEGIRRNEGRLGAQQGPLALRSLLARLAYHQKKDLLDLGDIHCEENNLERAQNQFAQLIEYTQGKGYKTLAVGGGHEIAWGHFCGLTPHYPKLGIINFDAHFDLRSLSHAGYGTSGTPFLQIADYCAHNNLPFSYCCVGIQKIANAKSLFHKAQELDVSFLYAEQIHQESLEWQFAFLNQFIKNHDQLYLSLCLDVFAEEFAPGVSAPQAFGLTPWQVKPLLKYILQTGKVVSIDIAELSPSLDQGSKTTRLAASLIAEILDYY